METFERMPIVPILPIVPIAPIEPMEPIMLLIVAISTILAIDAFLRKYQIGKAYQHSIVSDAGVH